MAIIYVLGTVVPVILIGATTVVVRMDRAIGGRSVPGDWARYWRRDNDRWPRSVRVSPRSNVTHLAHAVAHGAGVK